MAQSRIVHKELILNLPTVIDKTGNYRIEYEYDAMGNKYRQTVIHGGKVAKVTDFVGNFVYERNHLAWQSFDEGRVVYKNDSTCFAETYIKDHLGNVRVAFGNDGSGFGVRQVNAYYPFGMSIRTLSSNSVNTTHRNEYGYNGKMYQDELGLNWYDYGARFYDPVVGRWWSVDPLAEQYRRWTAYNYCIDNPMRFVDPDGMAVIDPPFPNSFNAIKNEVNGLWNKTTEVVGQVFTQAMMLTDVDDAVVLGTAIAEPFTNQPAIHFDGTPANGEDIDAAKAGLLLPVVSGAATNKASKVVDKTMESSGAARREAMRETGIPTSQPLIPDKATKSTDKVFLTRDGKSTVQNAKGDVSHKGEPHWEAGPTKKNDNSPDGLNRSGRNNKPQISKPKAKVYYEDN